jgi:predicted O-methyltransferase YrrM
MEINSLDCSVFDGGWSYSREEIQLAISLLPNQKTLNILEFGCGDSSIKLFNLLNKKWNIETYKAFESNSSYFINDSRINCILYKEENINNLEIGNEKYDFILIDGPIGVLRKLWYSKIVNNVKIGTIILIDDWCHYKEFEESLIKDFGSEIEYETIEERKEFDSSNPDSKFGSKCWKIIRVYGVKKNKF